MRAGIVAASVAGHVLVFALIGLGAPGVRERFVPEEYRPMAVDLVRPPSPPRAAPPAPPERPAPPSRARPREALLPRDIPVQPLPLAPVPRPRVPAPPAPAAGGGSGGATPGPGATAPGGDLRGALRGSTVGCANRGAVGLNRREIEACDERLGTGAKDAPWIAAPLGRDKRDRYDAAAARKERDRKWREGAVPVGIDPSASPGQITGLDK